MSGHTPAKAKRKYNERISAERASQRLSNDAPVCASEKARTHRKRQRIETAREGIITAVAKLRLATSMRLFAFPSAAPGYLVKIAPPLHLSKERRKTF